MLVLAIGAEKIERILEEADLKELQEAKQLGKFILVYVFPDDQVL